MYRKYLSLLNAVAGPKSSQAINPAISNTTKLNPKIIFFFIGMLIDDAQDKRKTPPFFMTGNINILKNLVIWQVVVTAEQWQADCLV